MVVNDKLVLWFAVMSRALKIMQNKIMNFEHPI